jgi:hypothetical protein
MSIELLPSPAPVLNRPLNTAERDYWINRQELERANATNEPIVYRWHWPRGTFDLRMSAWEIAAFVLPHMASILPFFACYPRVYWHWQSLLNRLILWPKEVIDEVVPWVRRVEHCEADEILELNIGATELPAAPVHFVLGGSQ